MEIYGCETIVFLDAHRVEMAGGGFEKGDFPLAVGLFESAEAFASRSICGKHAISSVDMLSRVRTALSLNGEEQEKPADSAMGFDRCGIVGENKRLLEILDTVARVAPTEAPVLILGENGTGKELVAQAIHANSRRRANPFVMVNLGGIAQSLFESEMFGHAKGAFTGAATARKGRFELADKGTIFLDVAAIIIPARRAMKVEPAIALKDE